MTRSRSSKSSGLVRQRSAPPCIAWSPRATASRIATPCISWSFVRARTVGVCSMAPDVGGMRPSDVRSDPLGARRLACGHREHHPKAHDNRSHGEGIKQCVGRSVPTSREVLSAARYERPLEVFYDALLAAVHRREAAVAFRAFGACASNARPQIVQLGGPTTSRRPPDGSGTFNASWPMVSPSPRDDRDRRYRERRFGRRKNPQRCVGRERGVGRERAQDRAPPRSLSIREAGSGHPRESRRIRRP
jgi:hypothetical protein